MGSSILPPLRGGEEAVKGRESVLRLDPNMSSFSLSLSVFTKLAWPDSTMREGEKANRRRGMIK